MNRKNFAYIENCAETISEFSNRLAEQLNANSEYYSKCTNLELFLFPWESRPEYNPYSSRDNEYNKRIYQEAQQKVYGEIFHEIAKKIKQIFGSYDYLPKEVSPSAALPIIKAALLHDEFIKNNLSSVVEKAFATVDRFTAPYLKEIDTLKSVKEKISFRQELNVMYAEGFNHYSAYSANIGSAENEAYLILWYLFYKVVAYKLFETKKYDQPDGSSLPPQ